jgi:subtilase family protein
MHSWQKPFWAGVCTSALTCLLSAAAVAAVPQQPTADAVAASGLTALRVMGAVRAAPASVAPSSAASSNLAKLDGRLVSIRQAYKAAAATGSLAGLDLHRQIPLARVRYTTPLAVPAVLVDVIAKSNPQGLKAQLEQLGFKTSAVFLNDIGGWLPVDRIDDAAALSNLHHFRTAMMHPKVVQTGPLATQGDFAQRSYFLKQSTLYPGLTGAGVTVGVISDSFDCFAVQNAQPKATHQQDYADDIAQGALPAGITVIEEDPDCAFGTDEGRAIAQIVYAVAPGAKIAFYTADGSEADFAQGIITLAMKTTDVNPVNQLNGGGAQIIDDDVGYFDEPVYQEGEVGIAIDAVASGTVTLPNGNASQTFTFQPAMYFSSAGNNGRDSYENNAPQFTGTAAANAINAGETLLNMDTSGKTKTYYLPITIPAMGPGGDVPISVYWDQPYQTGYSGDPGDVDGDPGVALGPGAKSVLDICVGDTSGNIPTTGTIGNGSNPIDVGNGPTIVNTNCAGPSDQAPVYVGGQETANVQPGEKDPYNIIVIFNPSQTAATAATPATLVVGLISGPAPGRVKVVIQDDGLGTQITQFATASSTIVGHPLSPNAMATGASFFYRTPMCNPDLSTAVLEDFSSAGGAPFLFDASGNALAAPTYPQKPDIVTPDGVNTTFLGFPAQAVVEGSYSTSIPQCQLNADFPYNFFGTSAAGPHAAGAAALMLQADPSATPAQVYAAMKASTLDMGPPGFDYDNGYGFLQADAAVAALLPAQLTLSPSSVQFSKAGSQVVTLSNSGTGPMTVSNVMVTPSGVTQTNTCSTPVAPGSNCQVTLTVGASGAGASQGVLSFATNAQGAATSVPVSVPAQVSVSPQSVILSGIDASTPFPTGDVGTAVVTVTNTGLSALDIGAISLNSSLVSQANTCNSQLAVGASCTVTLTLNTSTVGSAPTTLVIPTNASNVPGGIAQVAVAATVSSPSNNGGGAFAPGLLLPGLALVALRRRRRRG